MEIKIVIKIIVVLVTALALIGFVMTYLNNTGERADSTTDLVGSKLTGDKTSLQCKLECRNNKPSGQSTFTYTGNGCEVEC